MRIGALMVVHDRDVSLSETLQTIGRSTDLLVLVIDNSTLESFQAMNRLFCEENGYRYAPMGENLGLSVAYNEGIRILIPDVDAVILLDDDTMLPKDWLWILSRAIGDQLDVEILVPLVWDQKGLLSPCRRHGGMFSRLKSPPTAFDSNLSAINSGMVLRSGILAESGPLFDEALFLDCIDHLFLFRHLKAGIHVGIYPAVFHQAFADQTLPIVPGASRAALERFHIFRKDYRTFCRICSFNPLLAEVYLLFRSVRLAIRHQTFRYLARHEEAR